MLPPDKILEARAVELLRRTVSYWQKLDDKMKAKVLQAARKAAAKAPKAERDKLQKKTEELRKELDWRKAYEAIKETISAKILTPDQRDILQSRPKGR